MLELTDKRLAYKELFDALVQCEGQCEESELMDEAVDVAEERESTDAVVTRRDSFLDEGLCGLECRLDRGLGLVSEWSEVSVEQVDTDIRKGSTFEGDS